MKEKQLGLYEQALSKAVIRQAIRDLGDSSYTGYCMAKNYVESEIFSVHCENAGYPPELLDSLKDLVLLSKTQRRISSRQVLEELSENYE